MDDEGEVDNDDEGVDEEDDHQEKTKDEERSARSMNDSHPATPQCSIAALRLERRLGYRSDKRASHSSRK